MRGRAATAHNATPSHVLRATLPLLSALSLTISARHGGLDALKWAMANGCEWDERLCVAAGKGGHVQVLDFAYSHGCEITAAVCVTAAAEGNVHVLEWAETNKCCCCDGVFHSPYWQGQRAHGLSRLMGLASTMPGVRLPTAARTLASLAQVSSCA